METSQWVAVAIGSVILALVYFESGRNARPAPFQYTVLRIMLALGCACIAVVLTGFLKVNVKDALEAGGALGVFVVVYFFAPAALPEQAAWVELSRDWKEVRDFDLQDPNVEDATRALNLLNRAGQTLADHPALVPDFARDHAEEFCPLYRKLREGKVMIPAANATSDNLLKGPVHKLAASLGC